MHELSSQDVKRSQSLVSVTSITGNILCSTVGAGSTLTDLSIINCNYSSNASITNKGIYFV